MFGVGRTDVWCRTYASEIKDLNLLSKLQNSETQTKNGSKLILMIVIEHSRQYININNNNI